MQGRKGARGRLGYGSLQCHDSLSDSQSKGRAVELWKVLGEDVESSGQVHPAIWNNDLGVGALLLGTSVQNIYLGKDVELACSVHLESLVKVGGVHWMDTATCERGFSIPTLTKTGQRYLLEAPYLLLS